MLLLPPLFMSSSELFLPPICLCISRARSTEDWRKEMEAVYFYVECVLFRKRLYVYYVYYIMISFLKVGAQHRGSCLAFTDQKEIFRTYKVRLNIENFQRKSDRFSLRAGETWLTRSQHRRMKVGRTQESNTLELHFLQFPMNSPNVSHCCCCFESKLSQNFDSTFFSISRTHTFKPTTGR